MKHLGSRKITPHYAVLRAVKHSLVVPLIWRSLVPYWHAHPLKLGHPVLSQYSDETSPRIHSATEFITRLSGQRFLSRMRSLRRHQIEDLPVLNRLRTDDSFGWINCRGICPSNLLPNRRSITFWDENFETDNSELTMARSSRNPNVNQTVVRRQSVPFRVLRSSIGLSNPSRSFGVLSDFLPPGVSYQILWHFQARNLTDAQDSLCQIKWDVDFTSIFTQFTAKTQEVEEPEEFRIDRFPDYLFDPADAQSISLRNQFEQYRFESRDVQR